MKVKTFFFLSCKKHYFVLYMNSGQMLGMQTISCHTLPLEICVCVCVCEREIERERDLIVYERMK